MNRSRARTRRLLERYNDLLNEYNELVRRRNRYVGSLATDHAIGRPPRATQAQQAQVRRLRKAGHTLREIVHETGLSLQTLRTMVGCQATGRPLRASEAQQAQVRKLREVGKTVRQIAHESNLSFQTIRTIIARKDGLDRTTKRTNLLQKIGLKSSAHDLFARPHADRGRAANPNQRGDQGRRTCLKTAGDPLQKYRTAAFAGTPRSTPFSANRCDPCRFIVIRASGPWTEHINTRQDRAARRARRMAAAGQRKTLD
jgi:hypothetical protein